MRASGPGIGGARGELGGEPRPGRRGERRGTQNAFGTAAAATAVFPESIESDAKIERAGARDDDPYTHRRAAAIPPGDRRDGRRTALDVGRRGLPGSGGDDGGEAH